MVKTGLLSKKGNLIILVFISFIISFLINLSSAYALPVFMQNKTIALAMIFLILLFTNMWILAEYGVSLAFFFFFGVLLVFGFIPTAVIVVVITFIYAIFCISPTPIDFMITKKVDAAFMRGLYFIFAEAVTLILVLFYGNAWILSNLVLAYLIVFVLYQFVGTTIYLLTGPIGLPQYFLRLTIAISLNWWLITTFGLQYVNYLQALAL